MNFTNTRFHEKFFVHIKCVLRKTVAFRIMTFLTFSMQFPQVLAGVRAWIFLMQVNSLQSENVHVFMSSAQRHSPHMHT